MTVKFHQRQNIHHALLFASHILPASRLPSCICMCRFRFFATQLSDHLTCKLSAIGCHG